MIIKMDDDKAKVMLASYSANNHYFYDALCQFNQLQGYESLLNQIACLVDYMDFYAAIALYRYVKHKFGKQYAIYTDLWDMEQIGAEIFEICEKDEQLALATEGKERGNKDFLWHFDFSDEDKFGSKREFNIPEPVKPSLFHDVNDTRYVDHLLSAAAFTHVAQIEIVGQDYAGMLLSMDTTEVNTIEAQMQYLCLQENYQEGLKYLKRVSDMSQLSAVGCCAALEIIMNNNPKKHRKLVERIVLGTLKGDAVPEIHPVDAVRFVYATVNFLKMPEFAGPYAGKAYYGYDRLGLRQLRIAMLGLCVSDNFDFARKAADELYRVLPNDISLKVFREFLAQHDGSSLRFTIPEGPHIEQFVPPQVAKYAREQAVRHLNGKTITPESLQYLSVVIRACGSFSLHKDKRNKEINQNFVAKFINTYKPADMAAFVDFLACELYQPWCNEEMRQLLLKKLFELGYNDKLLVSLRNYDYYVLDCSKLQKDDNLEVLSTCCSLFKVEDLAACSEVCRKLVQRAVEENWQEYNPEDKTLSRKIAYAVLMVCNEKFAQSWDQVVFTEEEKALYKRYING